MTVSLGLSLGVAGPHAAMSFTTIDLGTFRGPYAEAVAVNDRTQVVGYSAADDLGDQPYAFLWTPADGLIDLGTFGGFSRASAVNALCSRGSGGAWSSARVQRTDSGSSNHLDTSRGLYAVRRVRSGCTCQVPRLEAHSDTQMRHGLHN
jgi:probable HAF family extracellular repeat protein